MVWHELVASPGGGIDPEREQERRLAAQARAGAEWALTALIARYQPAVVRYLVRLTGSPQRGQLLAQQVFVQMGKRLRGPHGGDHLRLWLLRSATEMGLEILRNPTRATPARLSAPEGPVALLAGRAGGNPVMRMMTSWGERMRGAPSERRAPAQEFVWQNPIEARMDAHGAAAEAAASDEDEQLSPQEALRHRMVRAVLAELPYGDAQCLALHLVAGLNQNEVAQALGVAPAVARRRVVQGLQLFGRRYDAALASLGLPSDFATSAADSTPPFEGRPTEVTGELAVVLPAIEEQTSHGEPTTAAGAASAPAAEADQPPTAETLAELAEGAPAAEMPSGMHWVHEDTAPYLTAEPADPRMASESAVVEGELVETPLSGAPVEGAMVAVDDESGAEETAVDTVPADPIMVVDAAPVPALETVDTAPVDTAPVDTASVDAASVDAASVEVIETGAAEPVVGAVAEPLDAAPPSAWEPSAWEPPDRAPVTVPLATPDADLDLDLHFAAAHATDIPDWDTLLALTAAPHERSLGDDSVAPPPLSEESVQWEPDAGPPAVATAEQLSATGGDDAASASVRVVPVLAANQMAAAGAVALVTTVAEPAPELIARESDLEEHASRAAMVPEPGPLSGAETVAASPRVVPVLPDPDVAAPTPADAAAGSAAVPIATTSKGRGQLTTEDDDYTLVVDAEAQEPDTMPAPAEPEVRPDPVAPIAPTGPEPPVWQALEARRRRVLSADGEAEDPENFPL